MVVELVQQAAVTVGSLVTLVGATWFLIGPRVREWVQATREVRDATARTLTQGSPLLRDAQRAADAAHVLDDARSRLAVIEARLEALTYRQSALDDRVAQAAYLDRRPPAAYPPR